MRFGIDLSAIGEWGHPRRLAALAAIAERSGWDGSCLYRVAPLGWEDLTPDDVRTLRAARPDHGFDIVAGPLR